MPDLTIWFADQPPTPWADCVASFPCEPKTFAYMESLQKQSREKYMSELVATLDESEIPDAQHTYWIPDGLSWLPDEAPSEEDFIVESDQHFHCGPWHERIPGTQVACKLCGGTHFEVAQSAYWTGIRCVNCKWECQIHEG